MTELKFKGLSRPPIQNGYAAALKKAAEGEGSKLENATPYRQRPGDYIEDLKTLTEAIAKFPVAVQNISDALGSRKETSLGQLKEINARDQSILAMQGVGGPQEPVILAAVVQQQPLEPMPKPPAWTSGKSATQLAEDAATARKLWLEAQNLG